MSPATRVVAVALILLVFSAVPSIAYGDPATVFAQRSGAPGTYTLSSEGVVSPELHRDFYGEEPWISAGAEITIVVADGGDFIVSISTPSNPGFTDLPPAYASLSLVVDETGPWGIMFGRVGVGFFKVDLAVVPTDPIGALVPFIQMDVVQTVQSHMLSREDARPLLGALELARLAFRAGGSGVERKSLTYFVSRTEEYVASGTIPWAKGQLWINAETYILDLLP